MKIIRMFKKKYIEYYIESLYKSSLTNLERKVKTIKKIGDYTLSTIWYELLKFMELF
jgi:hypothetical protein